MDGQGTKRRRKIAENFNRLSRLHERYRQTTDRRQADVRAIAYSELEREFTFAKSYELIMAAEGRPIYLTTAILFFLFVTIDERPAMGSQPNLAGRSQVVSMYKSSTTISGLFPKIWGAKNVKLSTTFLATYAVDTIISGRKRRIDKPKY